MPSMCDSESLSYKEALNYIYSLRPRGVKFGLDNERYLLKRLHIDYNAIPVFHVAGTNGKGSVSSFIASILKSAGYKVGLYTSPHLEMFGERIQIDGVPLSCDELCGLLGRIMPVVEEMDENGMRPTFFEVVTAMAFLHFHMRHVDVIVLEVGMGGRLDATNVIDHPVVSVITNVAIDHQAYLGYTLKEIAYEKSGIIKPGCPVVTGSMEGSVVEVIAKKAERKGSPLYIVDKDFGFRDVEMTLGGTVFDYFDSDGEVRGLRLSMLGRHQILNASISLKSIRSQARFRVDDDAIRSGFRHVFWPGRFEVIRYKGKTVVLDGAHNCNGASALGDALNLYFDRKGMILIVGILGDKDAGGILKYIMPFMKSVIVTKPDYYRAMDIQKLYSVVSKFINGEKVYVANNVPTAIGRAFDMDVPLICVTGSLYTVGEARTYLESIGAVKRSS